MKSTTRRGRRPVSGAPVRHPQHRARSAQRVREAYEQFRLAQEALGIVTWIWDPATERTQWYGDAAPLLGLPPGKFSGRFHDYLKRVHPDDSFRLGEVIGAVSGYLSQRVYAAPTFRRRPGSHSHQHP